MIDIDYIKSVLNPTLENERKIGPEDIITQDIIEIIRAGKVSQIPKCFKPVEVSGQTFKVLTVCNRCKSEKVLKSFSKTQLLDFMKPKTCKGIEEKILCTECLKKKEVEDKILEKQKAEEQAELKAKRQEIIEKNTNSFILNYLDPNRQWNEGVNLKTKVKDIIYLDYLINDDIISEYIRCQLRYEDFLNTPYWNAISQYAKSRAKFKCQLCNCTENLNTHHRTYERHGREHLPQVIKEDLIVLCQDCHSKFHE